MANLNFNKVVLGGRLTADPELKQTPSGVPVLSFTVAVNRKCAGEGAAPQTDFINCVAWRKSAEFISKYFRKGSCICIVGSLQVRSWQTEQGEKRYATEVMVDEAYFVDSKSEGNSGGGFVSVGTDVPDGPQPDNHYTSAGGVTPQFETISDDEGLPF